MTSTDDTIVIVGAGLSGIVQAKWLLQYNVNAKILLFEEHDGFGGVWDVSRPHGVMDCTFCNVSKYLMELTDFPWPENTVDFPHHTQVLQYLIDYAENFIAGTRVQCKFGCSIQSIFKYDEELIKVEYYDKATSETITIIASHAVIANGHSATPHYPVPNVRTMPSVSHSCTYKNCFTPDLCNKEVLVVGLSFSAVDIAVDLKQEGNCKVSVLTRNGSWFTPKRSKSDIPSDIGLPRLFTHLPHTVQNTLIKFSLNFRYFNQDQWEVPSSCDPAGGSLVSSDDFVELVKNKSISVIHGSIENVYSDCNVQILSDSGNMLSLKFDHVMFCTGYTPRFDFLSDQLKGGGLTTSNGFYPNLYLNMVPPDHSSLLSYIGLFNVKYTSPFQIVDLQAQYIARRLAGKLTLPSRTDMKKHIEEQWAHLKTNCKSYRSSLFMPSNYRDTLAETMGCVPNIWFIKSPKLWIQYHFGPITWAGYKVDEPELREAARRSLDDVCDRAWGKHWCLKAVVVCVSSTALLVGLTGLRYFIMQ